MAYVDGFVLPVPKKNLNAYWKMARLAGKVWKDHGALGRMPGSSNKSRRNPMSWRSRSPIACRAP